jgi:hypothetical protein
MIRRRLILLLGLALALLVTLVVFLWLTSSPVCPRNLARIHLGMEEEDVESLLGKGTEGGLWVPNRPGRKGVAKLYDGDDYTVVVWYDAAGRVSDKEGFERVYKCALDRSDVPLPNRVRRWLQKVLLPFL